MPRLLTAKDAAVWAACFAVVAAWLVLSGFTSDDPDSALHAALSAKLSRVPVAHWIAPEWWGEWNSTGLYREHPAGIFLPPVLLGRLGIPPVQASYIVGTAAGIGSLVLLALLISRVTSAAEGRAALVLLQLMPIAFVFRIRANHEYPMLLCLLATLVGLDGVRRSWRWFWLVSAGLTAGLLIKGVFVVLILLAAALWVLLNPTRAPQWTARSTVATVLSLLVMGAVAIGYDAAYRNATGETFWQAYWARQLGPVTLSTPLTGGPTFLEQVAFYITRLLWHPAPWSIALIVSGWHSRRTLVEAWHRLPESNRHALVFVGAFAVLSVLMLSPSSRIAERYAFSPTHAIAAAGVVAACRVWPGVAAGVRRLDARVPALPAMVWLALMMLRLSLGSLLPRVSIDQLR